MSGAVDTLLGGATAASGSGSGINAMPWSNISAKGVGTNQTLTFGGFSGSITISMTVTGGGIVGYRKNSTFPGWPTYTGPFTVVAGDTLSWAVQIPGSTGVSGTVTVKYGTTTLSTFTYVLGGV